MHRERIQYHNGGGPWFHFCCVECVPSEEFLYFKLCNVANPFMPCVTAGMRVLWMRCWKGRECSGRCVVEGRIAWGRATRRRKTRGSGSAERRATSCRRWPCDGLRELLGSEKWEVWCASARIGASGAWWMIGAGGGAALTQSRAIYLPLNSTCNEECSVGGYTMT